MKNDSKLKVGVIGCGNMGRHHAKAYTRLETCDFIAVCDQDSTRFDAIEKQENTQWCETLDSFFEHSLDAVSVCVPTNLHFDVVRQCLNRNIAVLVEKPISHSVESAQELIDLSKQKNVVLTVGHIERFNPAIVKAKQCIDDGLIGDIHVIQSRRYGPFPPQIKDSNVTVDVAVHDIDIAQYFIGKPVSNSMIIEHRIHSKKRADFAQLFIKFGDDITVNIFCSWAFPFKKRDVEVVGESGVLAIDCLKQTVDYFNVEVDKDDDNIALSMSEKQSLDVEKKEPIIEECRCFVDSVLNQTAPIVLPEQALASLGIALQQPSPALV